jgi:fumarylacetoacetate (FAA) hydrolase family protein
MTAPPAANAPTMPTTSPRTSGVVDTNWAPSRSIASRPGDAARRSALRHLVDTFFDGSAEKTVAALVGGDAEIAAFTLMNDWSARDVQAGEMTVGLGPHKAKDFAISLGPWLVTPDELPYEDGRLRLDTTVAVNGRELSRCDASEQHFGWPELLAHAARDTRLRPGDVLGSGTLAGGCLLELGPQDFGDGRGERWIEPGDVVTLSGPGLGSLETPVV